LLNKRLVYFLEKLDNDTEIATALPSSDAIREALARTIDSLGSARDTFTYSSFITQRKHFYKSYKHVFTCVSQLKELLETAGVPAEQPPAPVS
jgi:hypothetical protein